MIRDYISLFNSDSRITTNKTNNKFELFNGRIGAVKATKDDAKELIEELNKTYKNEIDFELDSYDTDRPFSIKGKTYSSGELYIILIYEDKKKPKDKICVEFVKVNDRYKEDKLIRSRKEIILSADKIRKAINAVTTGYSLNTEERERKYRKDAEDFNNRVRKIKDDEEERTRKALKQWQEEDDEYKREKEREMRKHWERPGGLSPEWSNTASKGYGAYDFGRL